MRLFRSPDSKQTPAEIFGRSTLAGVQFPPLVWHPLSLDDFGIIATHYLPRDWVAGEGDESER